MTKTAVTQAPRLRTKPSEVVINRNFWCRLTHIDADGRVDALGAYLRAGGVPDEELLEAAHLPPWSMWAKEVCKVNDMPDGTVREERLTTLFRMKGITLRFVGVAGSQSVRGAA